MLETYLKEQQQQDALEKIQNIIRNTKAGITMYLNDYTKGKYNVITTISATGQLLRVAGENINEHIKIIEDAFK